MISSAGPISTIRPRYITAMRSPIILWKVKVTGPMGAAHGERDPVEPSGSGIRTVLRDRTFMFFVLIMGLEFVVYSQTMTTLPIVMTQQGYPTWKYRTRKSSYVSLV